MKNKKNGQNLFSFGQEIIKFTGKLKKTFQINKI